MAFRFKRRSGMAKQLEHIVRAELDASLAALSGAVVDEEAIHGARKGVKKARAVLRLLRAPLGSGFVKENAQLRGVGHSLSSIRDAAVALETLRALGGRYRVALPAPVVRTAARVLGDRKQTMDDRAGPIVEHARRVLVRSTTSAPASVRDAATFRTARRGAVHGYHSAQNSMESLAVDSTAIAFHEWRKKVKTHFYQVQLFERLHQGARRRAKTLGRLETWLGEEHDLALLRETVISGDDEFGGARSRALLLGCIVRRQTALRKQALALGRRTFAQRPRAFESAVTSWWRSSIK